MKLSVRVERNYELDGMSIYLYGYNQDKAYSARVENGKFIFDEKDEFNRGTPFLTLYSHRGYLPEDFFHLLAEELNRNGFHIEVDNKELSKQTALAEEREKQIEYLKTINDKIVDKVLK